MDKREGERGIVAPVFSSDIAYLERIHRLLLMLQDLGSGGDFGQAYFFTCEQLHMELAPRIQFEVDRELVSQVRRSAYKSVSYGGGRLVAHKFLSKYHALLNLMAHKYKLILRDQESVEQVMNRGI